MLIYNLLSKKNVEQIGVEFGVALLLQNNKQVYKNSGIHTHTKDSENLGGVLFL